MTREFIMMLEFDRQWQSIGFGDYELRQLQEILLNNPKAGKSYGELKDCVKYALPLKEKEKVEVAE